LIYRVEDKDLFVSVIAVGKRTKNKAYQVGEERQ
jgi:mRNA-degrading endonuclease RelE of RelBE toxin-antitoxin system